MQCFDKRFLSSSISWSFLQHLQMLRSKFLSLSLNSHIYSLSRLTKVILYNSDCEENLSWLTLFMVPFHSSLILPLTLDDLATPIPSPSYQICPIIGSQFKNNVFEGDSRVNIRHSIEGEGGACWSGMGIYLLKPDVPKSVQGQVRRVGR